MILDFNGISNVVLKNPNRDLVSRGQAKSKILRMHMYGDGLEAHLPTIDGFEKKWMRKLRIQYTRSNKDLFSRLGRPVDKTFSARGGSIYYNLSKGQEARAIDYSKDVRDGYSIKDWVENFWQPHYKDDPCGVIMMELLSQQQAILARQQGRSFVYPTYKSIMCIYDYQPKGVMLEYICFQLDKAEKLLEGYREDQQVFRLVDDAYDYYIVVEEQKTVRIDWSKTLKNLFGRVPCIINSDIVDPELDNSFLSIFDDVVPLANEFLLKGSIKVASDFRHGFPKYAEFADDCPVCNGEGVKDGDDCTECRGNGKVIRLHVSTDKLLNWPDNKDVPLILPKDTGGYIEPSKTYYEIAISDMTMLENYMCLTLWGVTSKIKVQGLSVNADGVAKTATEDMNEIKPQADRLTHISKSAEKRHKFILDLEIQMMITASYTGSSVNYGRRYMLEGPDALWLKYSDARTKGVSVSALDELLLAYYEAEYISDPVKLAVQTKLMKVEPFLHNKPAEVLAFRLSDEDYKAKLFFGDWKAAQASSTLYALTAEELKVSLYEYAGQRKLAEVTEPVAA